MFNLSKRVWFILQACTTLYTITWTLFCMSFDDDDDSGSGDNDDVYDDVVHMMMKCWNSSSKQTCIL